MYFPLIKSTAGQFVPVRLYDSADHVTPQTGVTAPTITVAPKGDAFAAVNDGDWTELGSGLYWVRLNATDTATVGPLVVRVAPASGDTFDVAAVACVVQNATLDTIYAGLHTAEDVAEAILDVVPDNGELTVEEILRYLLAMACGKIVKTSNSFVFYEQDDSTPAFTLTLSDTTRVRA